MPPRPQWNPEVTAYNRRRAAEMSAKSKDTIAYAHANLTPYGAYVSSVRAAPQAGKTPVAMPALTGTPGASPPVKPKASMAKPAKRPAKPKPSMVKPVKRPKKPKPRDQGPPASRGGSYSSKGHFYGGTKRPKGPPKKKRPMGPKKPK